MKRFLSAAILAAMFICGWVQADVLNGGFELGTPNDGAATHYTRVFAGDTAIAGWNVTRGNVDWFSADAAQPCTGNRSLELNGNTDAGVSQSFATKPGVAYRVTFCLAGNPNGPPAVKTVLVTASGNPYAQYDFDTTGKTLTAMGWETRAYSFVATGAFTILLFDSATKRDDAGLNAFGPVIDNVVVAEDRLTRTLTDQWWVELESGWGAAVLHQGDTLFIDIFVYGPDGKPTWFVAAATYQSGAPNGHVVFSGDLYRATGPYYGGPFGAAPVVGRKVGTLTFDSDGVNAATLSYTVDGTPVVKNVTRQTWTKENLAGSYFGGFVWDQACGPQRNERDHFEFFGAFQITHAADDTVGMVWQIASSAENGVAQPVPGNAAVTISGPYTQSGHLGRVDGTMTFVFGADQGSMPWTLIEIERTTNGVVGRLNADIASGDNCRYDGRFGGVRR